MLFKKILFILLIIISAQLLTSQNVRINGYAPFFKKKHIEAKYFYDLITPADSIIGNAVIDSLGYFRLDLDIKEYLLVNFYIGHVESELYVEPDSSYDIVIDAPDIEINDDRINYNLRKVYVNSHLKDTLKNALHNNIQKFNEFYNYYLSSNYKYIRYRNFPLVDTFRILIRNRFPEGDNQYFNDYVKYRTATMEQYVQIKSDLTLSKQYIRNNPVDYKHIEYMNLFNNVYIKYLTVSKREQEIHKAIEGGASFKELCMLVDDTAFIPNARVKELVLLNNLYDCYYSKCFTPARILPLIEFLKDSAEFKEHRVIAQNILKKINKLKEGSPSPDFEIDDNTRGLLRLSDFKGKFVFISFLKQSYIPCLKEIEFLKDAYKKYNNNIVFISIFADNNEEALESYLKAENIEWYHIIANNRRNKSLLDDYDIKTFPLNVMIDHNGNIWKYNSKSLHEGGEYLIKQAIDIQRRIKNQR